MPRGAQQHRLPLAHVEHPDIQRPLRRRGCSRTQQRQQQQQGKQAPRHAARHQQPEHAKSGQQQGRRPRLRQEDLRMTPSRGGLQQPPQQVHAACRGPQHPLRGKLEPDREQPRAGQAARHYQQADPRHRHQVEAGAHHRGLPEKHDRQRQQAKAGHQLGAGETSPARQAVQVGRQAPQQPGHAKEGQPEAGTEHGQRIQREHRQKRQRIGLPWPLPAAQQHGQQGRGDHQQAAHRGQPEARQRRVDAGDQQRGKRRALRQR